MSSSKLESNFKWCASWVKISQVNESKMEQDENSSLPFLFLWSFGQLWREEREGLVVFRLWGKLEWWIASKLGAKEWNFSFPLLPLAGREWEMVREWLCSETWGERMKKIYFKLCAKSQLSLVVAWGFRTTVFSHVKYTHAQILKCNSFNTIIIHI